ncbi:hypothetical protein G7046_g6601 [Stylonectria norvegica]|nr:hypothetical protein G7046_g6601 [Stylonectria norvegica]
MWAASMPYYSEYNAARRQRSASQNALSKFSPPVAPLENNSAPSPQPPVDFADMLEPAMEGPPSPERIRELSKQMKRSSHLNRGHGRRAASSGSSPLLSITGERPAWEQALENVSLTRQSSTASSSRSRERTESVQVLGKNMNIFHRRGKSSKSFHTRRESSSHSSSGSSLYSAEQPSDNSLATLKESFMPTIFARRKPIPDDSASALQRKLQISDPFNFQHVTHTPKDQLALANLQRNPGPGVIKALQAQDAHFPNHSSEDVNRQEVPLTASAVRPQLLPRHTTPVSGARRLLKHVRSQDQLRASPPRPVRPPRSPIEPTCSPILPPVPPPRLSSRLSIHQDGPDALAPTTLDRPQTSGGFRRPQPYSPDNGLDSPTAASHVYGHVGDLGESPVDEARISHAVSTADNAPWPLGHSSKPSYETPLPDVPEEEEQFVLTRRSRISLASNNSSLRGSQSVPVLRALAQAQRPMSGASDTLGGFEISATLRATRGGYHEAGGHESSPIRESWEDDIDYCYEHEADANFNYEWERPSVDVGRDGFYSHGMPPPVQVALVGDELMEATPSSTAESSPGMLSASRFDMPALSPASQASTTLGDEALTPATLGVASNFSFPRSDKAFRPSNLRHSRSGSQASSFRESQGFTLSPSLLIPGDYHQQMLLTESERQERADFSYDDEFLNRNLPSTPYEDGGFSSINASPLMFQQRSSISTTATNSTTNSNSVSDSTGERHVSANSTYTNLTRFTSSTSLNKMTGSWSETSDRGGVSHLADPHDDSDQETTPPASKDNDSVPELTPFPSASFGRKSLHKSHASESLVRDELPPLKSAEAMKTRRPRARTTSMSAQAPPVGQYALFPRTYVKGNGNGDRI